MTSIHQDLTIYSGDTERIMVTYTDPSTKEAVDITGFSANFYLKRYPAATPSLSKSTTSGIELTDPTNGVLTITLAKTDTSSLIGQYMMFLTVTDTGGNVSTIMTGMLDVVESAQAIERKPTYCSVEDVVGLLRLSEKGRRVILTEATDPKRSEVETLIMGAEDSINEICQDSWMETKSDLIELSLEQSFSDRYSHELTIPLNHAYIRDLDWTQDDVLEAWNGNKWVDLLNYSNYTEGKGKDFYVDYELGVLYLYGFRPSRFTNVVRIKYRYGHDEVPYDIKQAAMYLTAVNLIRTDFYNVMLPDQGDSSVVKRAETCEYFETKAMMLLARHKRCYVRY